MTGYHTILLQRHDVADREAMPGEISRALKVENLIDLFKRIDLTLGRIQRTGVYQIVVVALRFQPFAAQPFRIHETKIGGCIITLQLIDGKCISDAVQKCLLALLPDQVHIHRRDLILDSLPILTTDTKAAREQLNILSFKGHCFAVIVIERIDGNITLEQFQGSLLGQGQHIRIRIAVSVHGLDGHRRVRHIPIVGSLHRRSLLYRRLNGGISVVIGSEDPLCFCLRYRRNGIQGILHLLRR